MDRFLQRVDIGAQFLTFAAEKDHIRPEKGEWKETEPYLLPQLKALVARYSKLGDNAFYKYDLPVDETVRTAIESPSEVTGL